MEDTVDTTKKSQYLATVIISSLMVFFSICVFLKEQSTARWIFKEGYLDHYYRHHNIPGRAPFWTVCCCPAIIVISIVLMVIVVSKKRSTVWRLVPLVTFAVLVNVLGWRCASFLVSYNQVNYLDDRIVGNSIFSRYSNLYMVPFLILELALIVIQTIFLLRRRKARALVIASIVLLALYGCTLCGYYVLDYYELFFEVSTEIVFIMMMAVYIIWDYMLLEPRSEKVTESMGTKTVTGTYRFFCPSCGARFVDGKKFCDQCGTGLLELAQPEAVETNAYAMQDAPSSGIGILGFLIPLAGFIMWVAWSNTMPKKAKSAGKGALIGAITYSVISIACIVLFFALL